MRRLKLFFACLLMAVLSIGQVWAVEGDTHDFEQSFSQLLNNNAAIASINIDAQTYPVKEVIVSYRYNNTLTDAVTMEVSVGGTSWGTFNVNGTGTNYSTQSFSSSSATGAIEISFTNNTGSGTKHGTFYVNNIQLVEGSSGGGDVIVKTLKSIAVTGQTTSYDQFESFSFDGTCTATYSVTKNDAPQDDEYKVVTPTSVSSPDMTTTGEKEVTVSFTDGDVTKTAKYNITVNAHEVTPGKYDDILIANALWGTSYTSSTTSTTANALDLNGSTHDIQISLTNGTSTYMYITDEQTRAYAGYTLTFAVPTGYNITKITFTKASKWGLSAASGLNSNADEWTGKANSVSFSFTARTDMTTVSVTYAEDVAPTACEDPTFTPAAGEYEEAQNVTISSLTDGATIYYTVDGSNPKTSGTKAQYTAAITVSTNQTIKAYAEKEGLLASEVAEAEYTFVAGPEVTLDFTTNDEWAFPTSKTVDADDYTMGSYTVTVEGSTGEGYYFDETNGNLLVGKSGAYLTLPTFDFPVSKIVCTAVTGGSSSVKFNLYDGVDAVSTEVSGCTTEQTFNIDAEDQESNKTYTIKVTSSANVRFAKVKIYRGVEPAVKKPGITGDENFVTSTEVTITCETTGATIYYTTDGTDPKTSGITSPIPFNLTEGATVKAAAKLGDDWSTVAEKAFTKIDALSTMEAVQAATPDEGTDHINIIIEDWIVTANKSGQSQVWIANANNTRGILLYQSGHGFAMGNKLNGVALNVGITKFNTAPELTSFTANDVTVTTADAITPNETTINAITTAIQGTVIKLKDLTYSSANSNFSDGENTIVIDTRLYTPALVNDATYDLTGVVMYASGGAIKLIPRSADDVVKTSADPLPQVDGLAALKAAELGSYEVTLTDAIVTLVEGSSAFIEDATAGALIYKSGHGFSAGDKLNGKYEVTTATFNGKFEITAIAATTGTKTTDAEIPVTTLTIAQLNANFAVNESKRIKIVGVNVTDAIESGDAAARTGEISDGTSSIILYAGKNGVLATLNDNIDVIGYPTPYVKEQTNQQQFAVWAQADITVNEKEDPELAWSRESDEIVQGASWTAPTLNNPHTVTIASYESDNESVATVTDGGVIALAGGLGTAVITAHFSGDETYEAANAEYTITVNEYIPANTDIITAAKIGVEGNSYAAWTDKTGFGTSSVYAGNSTNGTGDNAGALQLRYNTSESKQSGIVLTSSNGLVLKGLSVTVKSGSNTLNVYAKNTAYTGYSDLYSDDEDVRGKLIGTVSATGAMTLEDGASYDDNYQYIGMRSANGALYLTNITITWGDAVTPQTPDPVYTEVRTGLTPNAYYTICLDRAVNSVKEGSIWKVVSKSDNSENPGIILESVTTTEAGRPYIIFATASTFEVEYTGDAVDDPVNDAENHGLVGAFEKTHIDNVSTNYIIYNNELYKVTSDNVYVGDYRAYLDMTGVPAYDNGSAAPGRRRVTMTVHGEQVATGMESIQDSEIRIQKVMIDGQLFILRGEKMYNVNGQVVK